jgi:hypothetical protein
MFENIVANIITSQFSHQFGRDRDGIVKYNSDPFNAMQVKFSLSPDYDREDGYRDLTILIFGGGSNYISVFAKLDWNVIALDDLTDEEDPDVKPGRDYVKGETPWVLQCHHDSCWRDSINSLLWEYRDRVSTIDSLFNGATGWYKTVPVDESMTNELDAIRRNTPGYGNNNGERVTLAGLEFKFPPEPHEHVLAHCVAGEYCTVKGCTYAK